MYLLIHNICIISIYCAFLLLIITILILFYIHFRLKRVCVCVIFFMSVIFFISTQHCQPVYAVKEQEKLYSFLWFNNVSPYTRTEHTISIQCNNNLH